MKIHRRINMPFSSIGSKIILPYFLLTLIVAAVGAFIVVNLVTSTLQERFNNQLLDAGRVVSESMVGFEAKRLAVLRQIAFTEGVAESVARSDTEALAALVPQILVNSQADTVALLDNEGNVVYGWRRQADSPDGVAFADINLAQIEDVSLVLDGFVDDVGDKRTFLTETADGPMLFTVGPLFGNGRQIGAVMVASDVRKMVVELTENAIARVTLYDTDGNVIATTLGDGSSGAAELLQETPPRYKAIINLLQTSAAPYEVVAETADTRVPLRQVEILNQDYQLAFGDWRLRDQSFGLFSVALPRNFIVSTAATSRNVLNLVFVLATVAVFTVGFLVARRIVRPIDQLVQTTTAVADGDLNQRTGIQRRDEIGLLAVSFDRMTESLANRNQELVTQKSELSAILQSIADGVVVLDNNNQIVNLNPTARQLLAGHPAEKGQPVASTADQAKIAAILAQGGAAPQRYTIDDRVVSATVAPVQTPEGKQVGSVVVLRDVTREAEVENLKEAFITSVSHELRTPLTIIKLYADLVKRTANGSIPDSQKQYIEKINSASGDLEQHIEKLISISELQAETLNLKREAVDCTALVQDVCADWQERMASKGLEFSWQLPAEPLTVEGDDLRLRWALENLLSNAYNYTPEEGRVWVRLFREGAEVRLEVADTGVGIAPADQELLFTRFFRAENESNYTKRGIGLGLYITRTILELHDGRVHVNSQLEQGSTFSCILPLVAEEAHQIQTVRQPEEAVPV